MSGKGLTIANALLAAPARTASPASFTPPEIEDWNTRSWASLRLEMTGAARDGAYLHWRYVQHPSFQYHFVQIGDTQGGGIGLLVWRLEIIRHKIGDQLHEVARIGRIVEFLPTSQDNAAELLSHLWTVLDAAGAVGCDCYLYHGKFGQWLADAGLHRLDLHPDGNAVPSRFAPLDAAGGQIRSAVSLRTPPWPAYPFSPECTWYWTKSDSDQDRPN
jgi:hypothetical protein